MAPSVRGKSSRVSKRQSNVRSNTKITTSAKVTKISAAAISQLEVIVPKAVVISTPEKSVKRASKRKHDEVRDDSDVEAEDAYTTSSSTKKVKQQLPTPPASQAHSPIDLQLSPTINFRQLSLDSDHAAPSAPRELPQVLQDFVSLHAAFLKAFTLHIGHNGQSAPANLDSLLNSVTRIWKKHTVIPEDIQRILAIYELDVSTHFSGRLLKHQEGPFKLTMTGSGSIGCNVEYVGWGSRRTTNCQWNEYNLQKLYEGEIESTWISYRSIPTCWLFGDIRSFPKLEFAVGVQTQARQARAETARREILGLSTQAQNRPGAQFGTQSSNKPENAGAHTSEVVKSRTMSLLDRVRAKASATPSSSQSSEASVRRYAIGRISEVVDILRMKQQQKMSSSFNSSVHSSPSKVRCKVSFSMTQLINDIKGSLAVPLGDAEIRMCVKILQDEIPGFWLSTYTVGTVESVILNGTGLSGVEVKRILEAKKI